MTRPRLLDLFCGAGGAAVGYHRAGFEVVGVDLEPQPNYPFEFVQADALDFPLVGFDVIHASPPCQRYSRMTNCRPGLAVEYPDLVGPTRDLLIASGTPYIIENVPGAPLVAPLKLCGCQFALRSLRGLGVRRERWFEVSFPMLGLLPPHNHSEPALPVTGHSPGKEWKIRYEKYGEAPRLRERCMAMGVLWMNRDEVTEAVPPAFTHYLGEQLMQHLEMVAA